MDERSPWARPTLPAAGWYHDGTVLRWWDGERWGPAAPPAPTSWQPIDEVDQGKTLAVLSHVGMFILAIILPLIFRQTEGKTNRYVRHHATEALNFQLTFLILWIGSIITVVSIAASTTDSNGDTSGWIVLPFLVLFALYAACAVLAIIGAVRAGQRRWWRYPIRIPFVRNSTSDDGARSAGECLSAWRGWRAKR